LGKQRKLTFEKKGRNGMATKAKAGNRRKTGTFLEN
jgi:hypothetical protein